MSFAAPRPQTIRVAAVDVDIWRLDLDQLREHDASQALLSPDELERAQRFRDGADRERWVTSRAALRQILSSYAGVAPDRLRFHYNEYGKPAFDESVRDSLPLFNLSHAGRFALCAVARCTALGVDVQRVPHEPVYESLVRHYCAAQEREFLEQVSPDQRQSAVCQLWAYKEAYVKALGTGFSLEPDAVVIGDFLNGHPALVRAEGEPDLKRWHLRELDAFAGHRAALAIVP